MKNSINLFQLLTISMFLFLCFSSCQEATIEQPTRDRIQEKHEPSDQFFMQRVSSDGTFSIDAYTSALQQLRNQAQTRTITGFDEDWFTQGPGNIGARINSVAVHPNDEDIIYVGFSVGGVFKTTDGGATWNPIFDGQAFLSIGDVVLDPNDPEIVYVGTGDVNITGFPFIGDGLYRSVNGGNSWEHLGLEAQRIISKVIVDPTNSNTIFTACMGLPFEKNNDRGLYRSNDNGDTWEQILFLSDSTGVIEMVMNPNNSQEIYAVGWDRIRNNFESIVSGFGAKVYKTIDGGNNWNLVEGGLPNDDRHSRMGITMHESNPDILYVQYVGTNQQLEAIYKTNDAGISWDTIPIAEDFTGLSSNAMGGFGWYFGKIRVNPNDENDIYLLGVDIWRTQNAGMDWERAAPDWWTYDVHADKHDLTFLPDGGVLLATDGGLYRSNADNTIWEDMENIPTTQFYRVAYNPFNPDWYYGGAQDNGTTGGNANDINSWERIWGGDGFQMAFDYDNPDRHFVETQRGNIRVTTDNGFSFQNGNDGLDANDRRNWDMPYFISSHSSLTLYTGTYRAYISFGEVPFWTPISEDLTDGPDATSRNNTITTLAESPLEEGLLYVGTGDGNLWRGEDTGNNWVSISNNLPDQYVTDVVASPTDVNTVYVTYSGYRDNDFIPRIHRSTDQGNSWEDISSNLPDLAINELLISPNTGDSIMFVATDGGIYGTVTAGLEWERLGNNMPIIPVYDMVINEAKNELVAGTFARSIMSYPLDSITTPTPPVSTNQPFVAKKTTVKITPTVTNNSVVIELLNTEPRRSVELIIISVDGKLMYQSEKINDINVKHQLDVSSYPAGQYFVKAKMRHKIVSGAFVKQ